MGERQAGVRLGGRCNDTLGLRFQTKNDALRFANDVAERGRRWAVERGLSFAKDHLNGVVDIHAKVTTRANSRVLKFIFKAAPLVYPKSNWPTDKKVFITDQHSVLSPKGKPKYARVFVADNLTGQTNNFIAPVIRLACSYKIDDIGADMLTSTFDCIFKVVGILAERKVHALSIFAPDCDRRVTDSLVKGVSSVRKDTGGFCPQNRCGALREAETDDLVAGMVVVVADDFIVAGAREGVAEALERVQIFPSSC